MLFKKSIAARLKRLCYCLMIIFFSLRHRLIDQSPGQLGSLAERTRRKVAITGREAGHAVVLQLVEECEPLHKVTIIPRGAALGATMQLPEKDRYTESRRKLLGMLAGLMGGRAAEELVFGDITTGAHNDLKQATHGSRA